MLLMVALTSLGANSITGRKEFAETFHECKQFHEPANEFLREIYQPRAKTALEQVSFAIKIQDIIGVVSISGLIFGGILSEYWFDNAKYPLPYILAIPVDTRASYVLALVHMGWVSITVAWNLLFFWNMLFTSLIYINAEMDALLDIVKKMSEFQRAGELNHFTKLLAELISAVKRWV